MDSEIDEIGRSDDKIGIGYIEGFKWRYGRIDLGLGVLSFPYER
jgi:hypothetical protein